MEIASDRGEAESTAGALQLYQPDVRHTGGDPPAEADDLPRIEVSRQLREVTADAIAAVVRANRSSPTIFRRGNALIRLSYDGKSDRLLIHSLAGRFLRNHLARVGTWLREDKPTAPPSVVVGDVEAAIPRELLDVPDLEAVVTAPVAVPGVGLVASPGYCAASRTWFQPEAGFAVPPVPVSPTAEQVREALDFVDDHLLGDFPFASPCDKATAWAALVLPFVRPLIDGPTPLHLFEAPSRGTGKTLLAQAVAVPALGKQDLPATTFDNQESESRKRITAFLRDSPAAILLDNLGVGRAIGGSSLAAVLTSRTWKDRIIGSSVVVELPVRCTWLASANAPQLTDELARRTLRCRLDARTARPHLRGGFRHPNLLTWAREHRPALVGSVLVLVQAWLAKGRPRSNVKLGAYEGWCDVVGGVLDVAGVGGLLREAIERDQREETHAEAALKPFLAAWWARLGPAAAGVSRLFDLAAEAGCLEEILTLHLPERRRTRGPAAGRAKGSDRSLRTQFGLALVRLAGGVFDGFMITQAGRDVYGRREYRLVEASSEVE